MSSKFVSRWECGKTGNLKVAPETSCVLGILHTLAGVQLCKGIIANQPLQHNFREAAHILLYIHPAN